MSKKILIVEEERDVVKLLRYNLEKEGFRVNAVTDGSHEGPVACLLV